MSTNEHLHVKPSGCGFALYSHQRTFGRLKHLSASKAGYTRILCQHFSLTSKLCLEKATAMLILCFPATSSCWLVLQQLWCQGKSHQENIHILGYCRSIAVASMLELAYCVNWRFFFWLHMITTHTRSAFASSGTWKLIHADKWWYEIWGLHLKKNPTKNDLSALDPSS